MQVEAPTVIISRNPQAAVHVLLKHRLDVPAHVRDSKSSIHRAIESFSSIGGRISGAHIGIHVTTAAERVLKVVMEFSFRAGRPKPIDFIGGAHALPHAITQEC